MTRSARRLGRRLAWLLPFLTLPASAAVGDAAPRGSRVALRRGARRANAPFRLAEVPHACYASPTYWEQTYAESAPTDEKDWLVPYDGALRDLVASSPLGAMRDEPLIELGCGNSPLAERLHQDGWSEVTACDISTAAVRAAEARRAAAGCPVGTGPLYVVADVRRLGEKFVAGSFGAAVDKGTLDALCCAEGWDYEAGLYADSVAAVLRPGGEWLCISLTPPAAILPVWHQRDAQWDCVQCTPWQQGLYVYRARRRADEPQGGERMRAVSEALRRTLARRLPSILMLASASV